MFTRQVAEQDAELSGAKELIRGLLEQINS